jgi:cytochrome subunit of sulfide dehydrogenase
MRSLLAAAIGCVAVAAATSAVWGASPAEPPPGAASCSGCHSTSPRLTSPVPRIAGVERATIVRAMQDFRSGRRSATVMDRIAKGFTDEEVQAIAAWYAAQR